MNHKRDRGQCILCNSYPCPDALEVLDNVRDILNVPEGESITTYVSNLIAEYREIASDTFKELVVIQNDRITELEKDLARAQENYSRLGRVYRNVAMKHEELIFQGRDVTSKLQWIINRYVPLAEDNTFTFPDGDTWEKKEIT